MDFIFKTTATMKRHNNKKWWIDGGIIPEMRITADSLKTALEEYRARVEDQHYITISRNAIKNKSEMYIDGPAGDPVQVGIVLTGKTGFEDRDNYKWSMQYIDLWVEILTVSRPDFGGMTA